jgi:Lrp/AsnC family transcriptional regulator for asnA, asnC and gidA
LTKNWQNSKYGKTNAAAFVFINVKGDSEKQVINDIKAIHSVEVSYLCWGIYDIILKIKSDSWEELKEFLTQKLRNITNVESVLTLLLTEENLTLDPPFRHNIVIKPIKNEANPDLFYKEKILQNFKSPILVNN